MTVAEEHRIDRSITIGRPRRNAVWRALTTPAELSEWFKRTIEKESWRRTPRC